MINLIRKFINWVKSFHSKEHKIEKPIIEDSKELFSKFYNLCNCLKPFSMVKIGKGFVSGPEFSPFSYICGNDFIYDPLVPGFFFFSISSKDSIPEYLGGGRATFCMSIDKNKLKEEDILAMEKCLEYLENNYGDKRRSLEESIQRKLDFQADNRLKLEKEILGESYDQVYP